MMLSKEVNQQIRCCLSNNGHVIDDAISITSCMGNCCKGCIDNLKGNLAKCFNCDKEHEVEELKKMPKCPAVKVIISMVIGELFKEINEKLETARENLTGR